LAQIFCFKNKGSLKIHGNNYKMVLFNVFALKLKVSLKLLNVKT